MGKSSIDEHPQSTEPETIVRASCPRFVNSNRHSRSSPGSPMEHSTGSVAIVRLSPRSQLKPASTEPNVAMANRLRRTSTPETAKSDSCTGKKAIRDCGELLFGPTRKRPKRTNTSIQNDTTGLTGIEPKHAQLDCPIAASQAFTIANAQNRNQLVNQGQCRHDSAASIIPIQTQQSTMQSEKIATQRYQTVSVYEASFILRTKPPSTAWVSA